MSENLVEVKHLQQYFPAGGVGKNKRYVQAVDDVSFAIRKGETLGLVGESGCGKSTVLSLAAGLLKPDSGRVTLRGQEIRRPPLHMGYMLQRDHLFPWLTVRENALLGIRVRQKEPSARQKRHVEDLLAACGLTEFADALPGAWNPTRRFYGLTDASRASVQTLFNVWPTEAQAASSSEP